MKAVLDQACVAETQVSTPSALFRGHQRHFRRPGAWRRSPAGAIAISTKLSQIGRKQCRTIRHRNGHDVILNRPKLGASDFGEPSYMMSKQSADSVVSDRARLCEPCERTGERVR